MTTPIMQRLLNLLAACMIVLSVAAQPRTISGKVTDNKGVPLGGATILEKELTRESPQKRMEVL